jgi:hypothetical protein
MSPTNDRSPEPQCTIEWFYEGYRAIWLYRRDDVVLDAFQAMCVEIAHGSETAETINDLTAVIEGAAMAHNLVVRVYPGPSHADPLRQTFRVGVFTEAPPEWPLADESE